MNRVELKLDHYRAIAAFMQDVELEPPDQMTPLEQESLALVKQIIVNIEKRRAQPSIQKRYRKRRAA